MKFKILIMLFSLVLTITACETEAQLTYKIKNETNSDLKVIFTKDYPKLYSDTITIEISELKTIAINRQGLSRVNNYKETDKKLRDFSRMDIYKVDTLKSRTNFIESENWKYVELSKHSANYILTVSNMDF